MNNVFRVLLDITNRVKRTSPVIYVVPAVERPMRALSGVPVSNEGHVLLLVVVVVYFGGVL